MSEEFNYMDESFKKMSEEVKASYNKSFWEDAKTLLENDALDNAFRNAAANVTPLSAASLGTQSIDDAFMDDAFREAEMHLTATYNSSFWGQMEAIQPDLQMDEAFLDAAKAAKVNYNPVYWGEADLALQNEGLHYEYQPAYWAEARQLLDRADRRTFFTKWSAIAVVLLLFSFLGIKSDGGNALVGQGKIDTNQINGIETNHLNGPLADGNRLDAIYNHSANYSNNDLNTSENRVANSNSTELIENQQDLNNSGLQSAQPSVQEEINQPSGLDTAVADLNQHNGLNQNGDPLTTQDEIENGALPNENPDGANGLVNEPIHRLGQSRFNNPFSTPYQLAEAKEIKMERMVQNQIALKPSLRAMPSIALAEIEPLKLNPTHTIAIMGGAGFGNSFGSNDFLATRRVYGGLEYMRHGFGKLRQFEFGGSLAVNYAKHDNFGVDSLVERFLENGDVQRYWYKLQVHDLFYANANLLVNYRINTKHKIKVGIGIERLLGVQSNMAYKLNDDKGIQTVNNNWGVQNGIKTVDMRFTLGYEYRLSHKFGFQLNAGYGVFDRSDNSFYGNSGVFDNEMNITLGLKYNLFTRVK